MNCDEYLSMLATLPVEELSDGRAREHVAGCRECDRVTRVVAERERNMYMAFGDLHSSVPAAQAADRALVMSRRRKVALYSRIGLGLLMVGSVGFLLLLRIMPPSQQTTRVSERFRLQCLSPEQAAEVLRPYRGATDLISFQPNSPLGVITVEAPLKQMAIMRGVLDRYDNPAASQCAVQVKVPTGDAPPR